MSKRLLLLVFMALYCEKPQESVQLPSETSVIEDNLKLRMAPNTAAAEIGVLALDTKVRILERSTEPVRIGSRKAYWYRVIGDDGLTGWVYGAYLAVEGDTSGYSARAENTKKKLSEAVTGRWYALDGRGNLTSRFVTLFENGDIEFGEGKKAAAFGTYTLEMSGHTGTINVQMSQGAAAFTNLRADMIGDTLTFKATFRDREITLQLTDKGAKSFRESAEPPASDGT